MTKLNCTPALMAFVVEKRRETDTTSYVTSCFRSTPNRHRRKNNVVSNPQLSLVFQLNSRDGATWRRRQTAGERKRVERVFESVQHEQDISQLPCSHTLCSQTAFSLLQRFLSEDKPCMRLSVVVLRRFNSKRSIAPRCSRKFTLVFGMAVQGGRSQERTHRPKIWNCFSSWLWFVQRDGQ